MDNDLSVEIGEAQLQDGSADWNVDIGDAALTGYQQPDDSFVAWLSQLLGLSEGAPDLSGASYDDMFGPDASFMHDAQLRTPEMPDTDMPMTEVPLRR